MAVRHDATLTDVNSVDTATLVNAGVAVELNGTLINYKLNSSVQAPEIVGQDSATLTHNSLLPRGDQTTVGVPEISISGVIDITETTSNRINLKFLQQILKSGHKFKLNDVFQAYEETDDDQTNYYRLTTLSGIFPNETVSPDIYVMATGLTVGCNTKEARDGQRMNYTLTMKEVQN